MKVFQRRSLSQNKSTLPREPHHLIRQLLTQIDAAQEEAPDDSKGEKIVRRFNSVDREFALLANWIELLGDHKMTPQQSTYVSVNLLTC